MKTSLLTSLFLSFMCLSLDASNLSIDSLATPDLWLEEQNEIGLSLLKTNQDFEKAVKLYETAYNFAQAEKMLDNHTELATNYGFSLYKNGEIQKSHTVLEEILPKIPDSNLKLKAEVNQILGMTLVFQSKFPEGYKYQMDALKYYTDIGDTTGLMDVYYDLGNNFATQGQSELALKNYEKGIELAKKVKDTKLTMFGITALGGAWAAMGDFEKALKYSTESIDLAKLLKDDEELAWASINRGHILLQLKEYKDAAYFLKQAYDLSFTIGNKLLTAYSLEQMSDMHLKQNHIAKAIANLDESLDIYKELGHTNSVKQVTKKYAEISYKQKDFEKYKEYTDQYIALKDSLYSKEMMESMASLKQDFELHKMERENQIVLLTKDKELAKAKNQITFAIIFGLGSAFILILVLMYTRNKSTRERNAILKAKNEEIVRQNEFLVNSNQDLEKFAYIISHDLKEPLRNINGFTKLLSRKLKKYAVDKDINEYTQFITNGTDQMGELLTGLLEYSKVSVNKSEKKLSCLDTILFKVLNGFQIQIDEKNCSVEVRNLPKISCRNTQLSQVFQNLIANAIKFSPDSGNKITIGVDDVGEEYRFYVKDEGIGIAPEYQKEIFVVFKRLHDRGTFTGSGIGLATCKKIIEDHGGRIWVDSEEGLGSCFYFTLPKIAQPEIGIPATAEVCPRESELEVV